jgi:hypothetical protein
VIEPRAPVSLADLRFRYLEPNFTAILPGKCQARCPLCIEPEGAEPRSYAEWMNSLVISTGECNSFVEYIGGRFPAEGLAGRVLSLRTTASSWRCVTGPRSLPLG